MKNKSSIIKLSNTYWIVQISLILLISITKNTYNFHILSLIVVSLLISLLSNNIFKILSSILQIIYSFCFLYKSVFESYYPQNSLMLFLLIIAIINITNLSFSIMSFYLCIKNKRNLETRKILNIAITSLFVFISIWSFWYFFYKNRDMNKYISEGNVLIEKIEHYKLYNQKLPISLKEIACDSIIEMNSFYYTIDSINNSYSLSITFEHWYNKNSNNRIIFKDESLIYDSKTNKWIHEE